MVYAEFGGQTECIMGNWKIENTSASPLVRALKLAAFSSLFFSFTKQTASYALTATQARLPCACAQMALACTALSCYFCRITVISL